MTLTQMSRWYACPYMHMCTGLFPLSLLTLISPSVPLSLSLHAFQGLKGHCYLLFRPSSSQWRLRKQQGLWDRQLGLAAGSLGDDTVLQTQRDCPEGVARTCADLWRLGSKGLEMLPRTGGGRRAGRGRSTRRYQCTVPRPPPSLQSKLSETKPSVGSSSRGSKDTQKVQGEGSMVSFCALPSPRQSNPRTEVNSRWI